MTYPEPTPVSSRDELMKAPPGLYVLPETKTDTVWTIDTDEYFEAELQLIARVRSAGLDIPRSVESVTVRPDGSTVIFQWSVIRGTERNRRPNRRSS